VTSFEVALGIAERLGPLTRQGVPVFMGAQPLKTMADLAGADVAIVGIPYVSPLLGYENDIAPRKVRIAGLTYWGTYVSELDVDPAQALAIVDYGDVDFPFGDTGAAIDAVERVVGAVLAAGCLPVTIGGGSPVASLAVANALADQATGAIGVISFDGHCDTAPDWGEEATAWNWVRTAYLRNDRLSRAHHVQIGLRGMTNRREDMAFFREHGMRTIMAREVSELGSRRLAAEAVRHATSGVDQLWLAVDLDVLDSAETPDWDWPDPYGLRAADVLETAFAAGQSGKLCGLSLMVIGGNVASVQRMACWIVLYGLAGYALSRERAGR
jgi:arginase family enzyme